MDVKTLVILALSGLLLLSEGTAQALDQEGQSPRFERLIRKAAAVMTDITPTGGRVYFPAVSTDPNAGPTYGVMPIWLWSDPHQGIRHIVAPSLTNNATFGATGTGRYYFYPDAQSRLFVIGSKSQHSDYRAAARYEDVGFYDGRCILKLEANHEAQGALRFFGIGPSSRLNDQTNFRLREDLLSVGVGIRYWADWQIVGAWRYRYTEISPGAVDSLPVIDPSLQQKTRLWLPRLSLVRDKRDFPTTPSQGTYTELFAEYSDTKFNSDATFEHYGVEWRGYRPLKGGRHVLAVRGRAEQTQGDVPFPNLVGLGGAKLLRGYGEGRFLDRGFLALNLEDRWTVYHLEVVNAVTEFQLAPFLDVGTVYPDIRSIQIAHAHPVGGLALRAVVHPTVVGSIDIGYGNEGPAVFVGIDYPF